MKKAWMLCLLILMFAIVGCAELSVVSDENWLETPFDCNKQSDCISQISNEGGVVADVDLRCNAGLCEVKVSRRVVA